MGQIYDKFLIFHDPTSNDLFLTTRFIFVVVCYELLLWHLTHSTAQFSSVFSIIWTWYFNKWKKTDFVWTMMLHKSPKSCFGWTLTTPVLWCASWLQTVKAALARVTWQASFSDWSDTHLIIMVSTFRNRILFPACACVLRIPACVHSRSVEQLIPGVDLKLIQNQSAC